MERIRIFVDFDGTVAEWSTTATMEEVFSPGYFANRPVMKNVRDALALLIQDERFEVYGLTSCDMNREYIRADKHEWRQKHLPFLKDVIYVPLGKCKSDYVPNPQKSDVLIDDYKENLYAWHGVAVKMLNGINSEWAGRMISCKMQPFIMVQKLKNCI